MILQGFASLAPLTRLALCTKGIVAGEGARAAGQDPCLGPAPFMQMAFRRALRECPLETAGDFDMTGGRSHYHPCRCSSITDLFHSNLREARSTSCATGR